MKRGPKSFESKLTVVQFTPAPVDVPAHLNKEEAAIFRDVVKAMPEGWFRADTIPLLIEYARAVDACNHLARRRHEGEFELRDMVVLLAAHDKQARLVAALATKMRLSQQSRILPQTAGVAVANKPPADKPWHTR